MKEYKGKRIVKGSSQLHQKIEKSQLDVISAPCILCPHSFSFLGDIDSHSGKITRIDSPCKDMYISQQILAFTASKGSSSGCVILSSLAKQGKGPMAIITMQPADYNLVEGAILGGIPFIAEVDPKFFEEIQTGMQIKIQEGVCTLLEEKVLEYK